MPRHAEGPRPDLGPLVRELRELRLRAGDLSESTLAKKIGYSRQSVSAVLNGRRLPRWAFVEEFAKACDAPPGKLPELHALWMEISLGAQAQSPGSAVEAGAGVERRPLDITWYRDNEEFYGSGAQRIRQARSEIRLTYVRQHPPTVYTSVAAGRYFSTVLEWARKPGARSVRRIIGVRMADGTPDRVMLEWLNRHFGETQDLLNYEARVMSWSPRADGINMALVDDTTTFLAFSGQTRQGLSGLSVESAEFQRYFSEHFEQLWAALVPLDDYLKDRAG